MHDKNIPYNSLPSLPPQCDIESKEILKKTIKANAALAELRGWTFTQSNPLLLLQSIALQEAKSSSEIENVVTTNDELYQALATPEDKTISSAAKEVMHYKEALWHGFLKLKDDYPLTINLFIELFQIVKQRSDGIRSVPGTVLKNIYEEVVYTPPDNKDDIQGHCPLRRELVRPAVKGRLGSLVSPNPTTSVVGVCQFHSLFCICQNT